MHDFLGNELRVGDFVVINKNTSTGSSTTRKVLKHAVIEKFTSKQVVTNLGYISPDNVIRVGVNQLDLDMFSNYEIEVTHEYSVRTGFDEFEDNKDVETKVMNGGELLNRVGYLMQQDDCIGVRMNDRLIFVDFFKPHTGETSFIKIILKRTLAENEK